MDFPKHRRQEVIDYIATIDGLDFAEIITYNTMQKKGSIKEIGRAFDMPLDEVDLICKATDENKEHIMREKYPKVFKFVDLFEGVITSMGSHPSGYIVAPNRIDLDSELSTLYTKESKYKVTAINMKELDSLNYVKLDVLGLRNMDIINETCKVAGIERLTPDNIDDKDEKVWMSMKDSTLGIFQFEAESAWGYIRELLSESSINNIKEVYGEIDYISLLSMANGAIRPAGESYRGDLAQGKLKDSGHEGINKLLKNNLGYLIYQEDIMLFLTEFCNFSGSESDTVRRGLAKKGGTQKFLPSIRKGFYSTMEKEYNLSNEEAEIILVDLIKVIEDASSYGFSLNHSQPYSYIGYVCAYLRYYYPYEFATTLLNVFEDKIEKSEKIMKYIKEKGYEVKPISFGKSLAKYVYVKEDKAIYKGLKSIKFMNESVAEELFVLSKTKKYDDFVELLKDISENTSLNFKQLLILIRLDFFRSFGSGKYLNEVYDIFTKHFKKTHKDNTKVKRIEIIKEEVKSLNKSMKDFEVNERVLYEYSMLGYSDYKDESYAKSVAVITSINTKFSPTINAYSVSKGKDFELKMQKNIFFDHDKLPKLEVGDLIDIESLEQKQKARLQDGKWVKTNVLQLWINKWKLLKRVEE